MHHTLDHGSKNRLTLHDVDRFAGDTLFDKIARAVCRAEVLPRKELYESWEVARRLHRLTRGRPNNAGGSLSSGVAQASAPARVVDLCCGHGLLGAILLILDRSIPAGQGIDRAPPPSSSKLLAELHKDFAFSYDVNAGAIEDVVVSANDVVVSAHACGGLSDVVLDKAIAVGATVAVLPCCHLLPHRSEKPHPLSGWIDGALAIDVDRAARAATAGYDVVTQTIDASITPKNRLLIALPPR